MNEAATFALLLIRLVDAGLFLAERNFAPETRRRYERLRDKMLSFAREKRLPTPAEWDELNRETDRLIAQLRSS